MHKYLIFALFTLALAAPTDIIQNDNTLAPDEVIATGPNDNTYLEDGSGYNNEIAGTFGTPQPDTQPIANPDTDRILPPINTQPTNQKNSLLPGGDSNINNTPSPGSESSEEPEELKEPYVIRTLPKGQPGFSCDKNFRGCQWCRSDNACFNQIWSCPGKKPQQPKTWKDALECNMCSSVDKTDCGDWYYPFEPNKSAQFHYHP